MRSSTRRRWRLALLGTVVIVFGAGLAAWTYYRGWWGGYEHRLTASVRHSYCAEVTTEHRGWEGDDMRALNAGAKRGFSAYCEYLNATVAWLRFPNATVMRRALAATPKSKYYSVCVSWRRSEVLLTWDVAAGRLADLCAARDGNVVSREAS
jgi:hypothetical protein